MKKILPIVLGVLGLTMLVLVAVAAYAAQAFQPVNAAVTETQRFVIPRGQAIKVIASRLKDAGLVRSDLILRVYLKLEGLESKLQAGSFELSPALSMTETVTELTTGTDDIWVTIPEGWRKEEIAESLARQELSNFDAAEFLELAADSEGQLFPDTYLVPREATAQSVYYLLTSTFEQKVSKGLADDIAASQRSLEEIIIMASLLEREAVGLDQMQHVAGILWNRIEQGWPLQVDATLQYVKGYSATEKSWWVTPLAADRERQSPFNTYQHPGLPPRPISNPGLDAIKAALEPDETDDLFYIHDRNGVIHYARTLDQHNANVQKYLR